MCVYSYIALWVKKQWECSVKMATDTELQDLKKKVAHLEYDELKQVKEDIAEIKQNLAVNNLLIEQSVETTNKLTDTLDSVKDAMIVMSSKVEQTSLDVKSISEKQHGLDNKSKFDIVEFVRNNLVAILLGVGALVYIFLK